MESRKIDHIKICLEKEVESGNTKFDEFFLKHAAAPEVDFDEISLVTKFLGKKLNYPLIIEGMTGGAKGTQKINKNLAGIAQEYGIGFGVGSERAAIENKKLEETYKVRDVAPDVFLIANLGAVQLNYGYGLKECKRAIEIIEGDALALHFNPLQEVIQPEGNKNFSNLISKINDIAKDLSKPVIVKETGCGISFEVAKKLKVSAIDVAGFGGTSWGVIEGYRNKDKKYAEVSKTFSYWGFPTAYAIRENSKLNLPLIASGGIRTGLDSAKAIALGADCCALALPLLLAFENKGRKGVEDYLDKFILELKIAMFLTGSKNIKDLKKKITSSF